QKLALQPLPACRFSSAGHTGEPNYRAAISAPQRTFAGRNFSLAPKNVLALCHTAIGVNTAGNRAAAADFIVVHDDKPAEIRDTIMIVNHERPACFNH